MAFIDSNWFAMVVMGFVNLINYMDRQTIAGVLGSIQAEFGIGDDIAGLLQLAFVTAYMLCAPVFGYLGDRHSRRWLMVIGVVLWSMTTLLGSFMKSFRWFLATRAMVGIGEASYSTIAPTIISDLFVGEMRSKMLAVFCFAIPVGSGLGFIVGSESAHIADDWRWALRVTPFLGIVAAVLLIVVKETVRGESEGSRNLSATKYKEDLKGLVKNRSYTLSTAGITCMAFVTGGMTFFGPTFLILGCRMQPGKKEIDENDLTIKFGVISTLSGVVGVPLGSYMSTMLSPHIPYIDPILCGFALLLGTPLLMGTLIIVSKNTTVTFVLLFLAQVSLNLSWAILIDILLYVTLPTRRSTAAAFQILILHMFGDAISPYIVGLLSEEIKKHLRDKEVAANTLRNKRAAASLSSDHVTTNATSMFDGAENTFRLIGRILHLGRDSNRTKFKAMQYALLSSTIFLVLGAIFFFLTAIYVLKDKEKAIQAARAAENS